MSHIGTLMGGGDTVRASLSASAPDPCFPGKGVQVGSRSEQDPPGLLTLALRPQNSILFPFRPPYSLLPLYANGSFSCQPWPSSPHPSQTQRPLPPPFSVPPPCCQPPGHSQAQLGRWALTLHLAELVLGGLLRLGAAGPTQLLLEQGRAQLGPGLWCHPSLLRQPIHSHHISSTQAYLGGDRPGGQGPEQTSGTPPLSRTRAHGLLTVSHMLELLLGVARGTGPWRLAPSPR